MYDEYVDKCKMLDDDKHKNVYGFTLKEIVGMKIYSDLVAYRDILVESFADMETMRHQQMKKNFYHWAMTLHQAFLYGALPPIPYDRCAVVPVQLYRGIPQIVMFDNNLPKYYGIFETSME